MSAKQKLQEAEFFLEKLRALQILPQDLYKQTESKYYLDAFLSAAVSVLDYLLEDYNAKFSLNIPLNRQLYPKTFEKAAREINNQSALSFIKWWKEEKETLGKDPIGKLLINKRHIDVHRIQIKPDLAKIVSRDSVTPSSSVETKLFQEGKLVEIRGSGEQPPQSQAKEETTFNWFFSECPDESVLTVCAKFLRKLTTLIAEAEQRFP